MTSLLEYIYLINFKIFFIEKGFINSFINFLINFFKDNFLINLLLTNFFINFLIISFFRRLDNNFFINSLLFNISYL